MNLDIARRHRELAHHPIYKNLTSIENIRVFMKYHVFAVWDFMTLLKSLQRNITCVSLPWNDSGYDPELVKLINEIVLGEESDQDQHGNATSHFSLYLKAMEEVGADTSLIRQFLKEFELGVLPSEIKCIVAFHLDIALNKKPHEITSSFFFGREKLIPDMFESIVKVLKDSEVNCPTLLYYLERHIEVDGGDHGPKALSCLEKLVDSLEKEKEVIEVARRSLDMRWDLWDFILSKIESRESVNIR